jgi:hypothetical protein
MGFFSWKTSDSDKSISNEDSSRGAGRVYMLTPTHRYVEDSYEGYGVFGGKDYYELVYELNKDKYVGNDSQESRSKGIDMCFDKNLEGKLVLPRFAESEAYEWADLQDSENCEHQGFFYDDEDN